MGENIKVLASLIVVLSALSGALYILYIAFTMDSRMQSFLSGKEKFYLNGALLIAIFIAATLMLSGCFYVINKFRLGIVGLITAFIIVMVVELALLLWFTYRLDDIYTIFELDGTYYKIIGMLNDSHVYVTQYSVREKKELERYTIFSLDALSGVPLITKKESIKESFHWWKKSKLHT